MSQLQKLVVASSCGAGPAPFHSPIVFEDANTVDSDRANHGRRSPEFKKALRVLVSLSDSEVRKVWKSVDEDASGAINYIEFCRACFPEIETPSTLLLSLPEGGRKEGQ